MEDCIHCGEVIVWDDGRWVTLEATRYCVLSPAQGRHVPSEGRVLDVRRAETVRR